MTVLSSAMIHAIAFALTGSDATPVKVLNASECIVKVEDEKWMLNNIDPSRITFTQFVNNLGDKRTIVRLHGNKPFVYGYSPKVGYDANGNMTVSQKPELYSHADLEKNIVGEEFERLRRAWAFVYENGCKGAPSDF